MIGQHIDGMLVCTDRAARLHRFVEQLNWLRRERIGVLLSLA